MYTENTTEGALGNTGNRTEVEGGIGNKVVVVAVGGIVPVKIFGGENKSVGDTMMMMTMMMDDATMMLIHGAMTTTHGIMMTMTHGAMKTIHGIMTMLNHDVMTMTHGVMNIDWTGGGAVTR